MTGSLSSKSSIALRVVTSSAFFDHNDSDSILYTTPSTFVFLDVMTVSSLQISFVVSE